MNHCLKLNKLYTDIQCRSHEVLEGRAELHCEVQMIEKGRSQLGGEVISQKPFHYGRSPHTTLSPSDLLKLMWSQPEALRAKLAEEKNSC